MIYAVGDLHGCADLLANLLETILRDVAQLKVTQRPILIFVGDYVDRGDKSPEVIDMVLRLMAEGRFEVRALKGNHEQSLLDFLDDANVGPSWAEYGGLQTLRSYGVQPPARKADPRAWETTREQFLERFPSEHLTFLRGLELMATYGDYAFVHAGVRDGIPLSSQNEQDLLWIRGDFLHAKGPFEKVIVHGHTPDTEPFVGSARIGIDTGAYATGLLTAVRLMASERLILQARLMPSP